MTSYNLQAVAKIMSEHLNSLIAENKEPFVKKIKYLRYHLNVLIEESAFIDVIDDKAISYMKLLTELSHIIDDYQFRIGGLE